MFNTYSIVKVKKIAIALAMAILFCSYIPNHVYAGIMDEQKKVLVINSYHQGFAWTKDVTDGIIGALSNSDYNISTFVEYMDWKNYPTNQNLQHLYEYYKYKYQNKGIDILVTADDAALEFALKNRKSLFSNAPIVFCGVNQKSITKITRGYNNLTGVLEEIDPTDTIEMALSINPSLKNIYILFDNSSSGISAGELTISKIESMNMNLNTIPLNNLSYDELIKNVRNYSEDSIILINTYYSDADGRILKFEAVSREVSENSSVPVYHLYDIGLNNGAFGGSMTDGRTHGKCAADLAIRILEGENPDNIPISSPKAARRVFDFQQLKRFDIPLSKIPKDCEVINKPFSFFET